MKKDKKNQTATQLRVCREPNLSFVNVNAELSQALHTLTTTFATAASGGGPNT